MSPPPQRVHEAAIRGDYLLLIMAEDIEQKALAILVVNKLCGRCAARRGWFFSLHAHWLSSQTLHETAIRGGCPLLIIMAEDIEQKALATPVINKLLGRCCLTCLATCRKAVQDMLLLWAMDLLAKLVMKPSQAVLWLCSQSVEVARVGKAGRQGTTDADVSCTCAHAV